MPINLDFSLGDFFTAHPRAGWLVAAALALAIVLNQVRNVPFVMKLIGQAWLPIARIFRHWRIQKKAVKGNIENTVNYAVRPLLSEMPSGDLKGLKIEYVKNSKVESFIREGKIIVRLRPVIDQDKNLINVLRLYLEAALMPQSRYLLNTAQRKAITYYTGYKLLHGHQRLVNKLHDEYFVIDKRRETDLQEYFNKIRRSDRRGFFYSIVLRVIEHGSSEIRFTNRSVSEEFGRVLDHITNFIHGLKRGGRSIGDKLWSYTRPGTEFSMLLVARPDVAAKSSVSPYLNRFKENIRKSDRVFVVFTTSEWSSFGEGVARLLDIQEEAELLETFQCRHDYRGEEGGIVRLYARRRKPLGNLA